MSNLYRAYAAVHNEEVNQELTESRDLISEMNLNQMIKSDLVEVCEEIVEGLFEYGLDLDEAYEVVSEALDESIGESISGLRKDKLTSIIEAFDTTFSTVTDKAERNCEEDFLLYRQNKPLTEKWNNRVAHETGNKRLHEALIAEDRHQVKFGLIEMISDVMEASDIQYPTGEKKKFTKDKTDPKVAAGRKAAKEMGLKHNEETEVSTLRQDWGDAYASIYEKKMDPVGQEDGDIDNDGDEDSSDEYLAKRRKAIGKAMKKEEVEQVDEDITSEKGKAKMKAMIDARTTDSGRAKKGQGQNVKDIKRIGRAKVYGYGGVPRTEKVGKNPIKSNFTGLSNVGDGGNKAKRRAGLPVKDTRREGVEYVDEADSLAAMQARREKRLAAQRKREGTTVTGRDFGRDDSLSAAQQKARREAEFKAGTKKEEVTFSEAELARIEEIVNSWED